MLVGRSKGADLPIADDSISRQHLKIHRTENDIYIEDISLSNWVGINENRIPKNTQVRVFDFTEIIIGEGISLKITTQHPDEDLPPSLDKTQITGDILTRETRVHQPHMSASVGNKAKRVSRTNKRDENTASDKSKGYVFKQLLVVIFLAASLLVYEFFLTDPSPQNTTSSDPTPGQKKSTVAVPKKRQKKVQTSNNSPSAMKKSEITYGPDTSKMISHLSQNNLCETNLAQECKKIFIETDPADFIVQGDSPGEVILYREYFHTLRVFFVNDTKGYIAQEKNPKIWPVLASLNLLDKGVLTSFEAKQITKIRINIYKKYGDQITEKYQYNLDTDQYKRINFKEVELAQEKVKTSGDYSYFDKYVIQHLEVVSGK